VVPSEALMLPNPNAGAERFLARKEKLIDAEIERCRIAKLQRENIGRLARREPLVEP
jgi:hypothetical protein